MTKPPFLDKLHHVISAEVLTALVLVAVVSVFIDSERDRRAAEQRSLALNGLAGMLRSSAALANSVWISGGASEPTIAFEDGLTIDIDLQTGYPSLAETGIQGMLPPLASIEGQRAGDAYVYTFSGVPVARCSVTYMLGRAPGDPPTVIVRSNVNGGDCS